MGLACMTNKKPTFIQRYTPVFFNRFGLSFKYSYNCADYYITDIETGTYISKDILFILDPREHCLVVSRFYPEIYRYDCSKYLSATCFYLLIQHFKKISGIALDATIYLMAKRDVFKAFYKKLQDFDFHASGQRTDPYVSVTSPIVYGDNDTLRNTSRWLDLIEDIENNGILARKTISN